MSEKLKPCPLCSATADSDGPRKSAKCADDTCPAGRQWVCWEMWQRLPRVSSDAQEVARETPTIQCATCHGDLVWAVNATRDRYIVTACEQCAAAGETPPEITITLGEGGHDLPRAYARADLVPDDPDISIFGGVPVIGVAAAGETQGSVYLQLHDHMWGKDCGVKAVHLTSNFEGVHAGPVPVHGAPKPKGEYPHGKPIGTALSNKGKHNDPEFPVGSSQTGVFTLDEIDDEIRFMDARLHGGQGRLPDAMCRLSLPMTRSLRGMVTTLEQRLRAMISRAEKAERNYQFMVDRAADEKLDGYRELGQRAADAERDKDAALQRAETAEHERDEARSHPHRRHLQTRAEQAERERDTLRARVGELETHECGQCGASMDSPWHSPTLRIVTVFPPHDAPQETREELPGRPATDAEIAEYYRGMEREHAESTPCRECGEMPRMYKDGLDCPSVSCGPVVEGMTPAEWIARNKKGEEDEMDKGGKGDICDGHRKVGDGAPMVDGMGRNSGVGCQGGADASGQGSGTGGSRRRDSRRVDHDGSSDAHDRSSRGRDSILCETAPTPGTSVEVTPRDKQREADPWCDLQHCLDRALITGNHQDHVGWLVQAIRLVNAALEGGER